MINLYGDLHTIFLIATTKDRSAFAWHLKYEELIYVDICVLIKQLTARDLLY